MACSQDRLVPALPAAAPTRSGWGVHTACRLEHAGGRRRRAFWRRARTASSRSPGASRWPHWPTSTTPPTSRARPPASRNSTACWRRGHRLRRRRADRRGDPASARASLLLRDRRAGLADEGALRHRRGGIGARRWRCAAPADLRGANARPPHQLECILTIEIEQPVVLRHRFHPDAAPKQPASAGQAQVRAGAITRGPPPGRAAAPPHRARATSPRTAVRRAARAGHRRHGAGFEGDTQPAWCAFKNEPTLGAVNEACSPDRERGAKGVGPTRAPSSCPRTAKRASSCAGHAGSGTWPMLVEIQALAHVRGGPSPRRPSVGLGTRPPYHAAGGAASACGRVHQRPGRRTRWAQGAHHRAGADLAVLLAIQSLHPQPELPRGFLAFGEVGAGGRGTLARGQDRLLRKPKWPRLQNHRPKANAPKKPVGGPHPSTPWSASRRPSRLRGPGAACTDVRKWMTFDGAAAGAVGSRPLRAATPSEQMPMTCRSGSSAATGCRRGQTTHAAAAAGRHRGTGDRQRASLMKPNDRRWRRRRRSTPARRWPRRSCAALTMNAPNAEPARRKAGRTPRALPSRYGSQGPATRTWYRWACGIPGLVEVGAVARRKVSAGGACQAGRHPDDILQMTNLRIADVSDIRQPYRAEAVVDIERTGAVASVKPWRHRQVPAPLGPRTVQWLKAREAAEPGRWRTIAGNLAECRHVLVDDIALGVPDARRARCSRDERAWFPRPCPLLLGTGCSTTCCATARLPATWPTSWRRSSRAGVDTASAARAATTNWPPGRPRSRAGDAREEPGRHVDPVRPHPRRGARWRCPGGLRGQPARPDCRPTTTSAHPPALTERLRTPAGPWSNAQATATGIVSAAPTPYDCAAAHRAQANGARRLGRRTRGLTAS